jgi:hypothetical protein
MAKAAGLVQAARRMSCCIAHVNGDNQLRNAAGVLPNSRLINFRKAVPSW